MVSKLNISLLKSTYEDSIACIHFDEIPEQ
jgi:hypothetical protein